MNSVNLEKSHKILNWALRTVSALFIILPIMLYIYTVNAENNYSKFNNFYKVTTTSGNEFIEKFFPSKKPITNLETTKDWLVLSMIDLMTYDAGNYNTEKRFNLVKSIMSENTFQSFWENDKKRIETDISNGYLRSAAIISYKPILLGQVRNTKGQMMWKFFLEIQIKQESKYESYPRYYKKSVKVIVKEMETNERFKGIGIIRMDIK